jgi:hypothetical protein
MVLMVFFVHRMTSTEEPKQTQIPQIKAGHSLLCEICVYSVLLLPSRTHLTTCTSPDAIATMRGHERAPMRTGDAV